MLTTLLSLSLALRQDSQQTIVTAPRAAEVATTTAASTQTITAEELERTGEHSLPRALARTSGLFVQETNMGGGAPILRGMIGNQILIVVDGVRLNDATTRSGPNQSLNGIDTATVERVEVIRGPVSVLYGSDALGGVILIWTKTRAPLSRDAVSDDARRLRAQLDGEYVSVNDGWRGSLGTSMAWENDGVLAIGSLQEWGDVEAASGTVDNTGYNGQAWFGSWEHALGAKRGLRFSASRTRDFDVPRTDRMNAGFGQTNPSDDEHFFTLQDRERYQLTYTDTEAGFTDGMQVRASLRRYDEKRRIRARNSTTRRLEQDVTDTLGLGADWTKALGDTHLLTWGFDADYDEVDSTRDNVNINTGVVTAAGGTFQPDSKYLSSGLFVRDEISAFEAFDLTAGLRYAFVDYSFKDFTTGVKDEGDASALTGSLQVARNVAEGARVTGTIAQAFRAPNLAELAKSGTFAGGTELANPDLDPETALYEEIALDLVRPTWNAAFGVYHNAIDNAAARRLISDPTPGVPGDEVYQRANGGELEYYGIEASCKRKLGGVDSPYAVEVYAEYTYGRQFDDFVDPNNGGQPFDDKPASKVPPLHGRVSALYEPAQSVAFVDWIDLSVWFAAKQDELSPTDLTDTRIDPNGTDAWMRMDLDLGGPLGERGSGATWNAGLHNLFDEEYRVHGSGLDAPGFGVVLGVHLSI